MAQSDVDLVIRGARLEDRPGPVDIAVRDGTITAIEPHLSGSAQQEIDAAGLLASPPFIDAHHHLDCAFLCEEVNHSGTLEEAIAINARIKHERSAEELFEKACRALDEALIHGTGWLRSHGDIDSVSGLKLMYPVLEAKEKYRGVVDVEFVTFPQLGLIRDPASVDYMRAAMQEGADVVGGMPHAEATMEDAARHIDICFEIAKEFDADIDMHVDETDDPNSRTLELLAEATIREGYQGRVTAGHCCSLAAQPDDYAKRVIDKVAEAEINVITNPLVNLYLQGRGDAQPVRRGITRVKELLEAGVNVACGLDDVKNIFFPYGRMDMLEVAMVTSITAHLTTPDLIQTAFDMPRSHAARTMRLIDYGIRVGAPADLVLFKADDPQDALRSHPPRHCVIRNGRIVAETKLESQTYL